MPRERSPEAKAKLAEQAGDTEEGLCSVLGMLEEMLHEAELRSQDRARRVLLNRIDDIKSRLDAVRAAKAYAS